MSSMNSSASELGEEGSSPLFAGLRFAFAGLALDVSNSLKKLVKTHNGTVEYVLSGQTSFLVTSPEEFRAKTSKVTTATKKRIPIVSGEFITASISMAALADPTQFSPTATSLGHNELPSSATKRVKLTDEDSAAGLPGPGVVPNGAPLPPQKQKQKELFGKWNTARVFISSTFRDMHGERDYLTKVVFPELQDRCNKLRVHVHPVDLRWGVTEEDTENATEICLTELDNCRPFFIGLLGERYGWVPPKYTVPDEPRFDWLKSVPPGLSITHLEMLSGALRDPSASCYAIYIRDSSFMQNVPLSEMNNFQTENNDAKYSLERLKTDVRAKCAPENVLDNYPCLWGGVIEGKSMTTGLEKFGAHVLETMWRHVQAQFPLTEQDSDPLSVERGYHERFVESHSRLFVGRNGILASITAHCDNTLDQRTLVITGEPGSGKTSLVSAFANRYLARSKDKEHLFVLIHFAGAAPGSTNIRHTLSRLVKEIVHNYDFDDDIPEDYKDLKTLFRDLIKRIGDKLPNERLVLVLDALNQLEESYQSHSLDWLPETVPSNVRLVVSTLSGDVLDNLKRREITQLAVEALNFTERKEIVEKTLWEYRKRLSDDQLKRLLSKPDSTKPLYLVVACEELRVFGVFEKLSERINKLSSTVPELFAEVLERLESDHGRELVSLALSLLACSRGGLLESELLQCLGAWDHPLPQSTWAPFHRSMKAYLRPNSESGEGVLDFFHQQLPKAVRKRYLTGDGTYEASVQTRLADFFRRCADPDLDASWNVGHRRGLAFAPYHQIQSKQWENLAKGLCNLAFIESKCEMGMTFDLVADYLMVSAITKEMPAQISEAIEEYRGFVQQRSHVLAKNSDMCFSMAASLPDASRPAIEAASRYRSRQERRPWMRWVNKPQSANPCIMTLYGHELVVRSCSFSPVDPIIMSASDDRTIKLWNATTGEEMKALKGHKNSIVCAEFSPDGKYIASGGYDKAVKIWNVSTGDEVISLKGHKGIISCLAWSPDGKYVASGGQDKQVKVFNPRAASVAWSPDGETLVSASEDGQMLFWNSKAFATQPATVHKPPATGNRGAINSIAFSSSGKYITIALDDRTVRVMDATTKDEVARLSGHNDGVCSAVMSKDEKTVLSASHDNVIISWDWQKQTQVSSLVGHTGSIFKATYSPDNKHIVSCSFDRSVKVWEVKESVAVMGHEARILSAAFSPDVKYLATGSRDKTAKVWDAKTSQQLHWLKGHTSNVFGVAWSPDSTVLVTASRDKTIKFWNMSNGKCFVTLTGHTDIVRAVDFSPNGEHLASCGDDKIVRIWNAAKIMELRIADDPNKTADFAQFGLAQLFGHRSLVLNCRYSPDGRRLATSSNDLTVKLWDTRLNSKAWGNSYIKVATFSGHIRPVTAVGWTVDSARVVSASDDKELFVWNSKNAKRITNLKKHSEAVVDVDITPDNKYILSGSTDSTCVLWNSTTYQPGCSFACLSRVCAVAAAPKGYLFAVGDGSGALYILTPVDLQ